MFIESGLVHEIRSLIIDTLLVQVESADTDLLATGLLDSLGLIELLTQLEQRFNVRFDYQSLELGDFCSPATLAALVARYNTTELKNA
jgi:D-alanine--poly(phosphoribitol) ligase subunit 2